MARGYSPGSRRARRYASPVLTRLDLRGAPRPLGPGLPRPAVEKEPPTAEVQAIIAEVRERGDAALSAMSERFDSVAVAETRVPAAKLEGALASIPRDLSGALEEAAAAVRSYHEHQVLRAGDYVRGGLRVRELALPVARAGCYVPGGRASYPSTVLMTAIPAKVAGVGEVALCVPPGPGGAVAEVTLAAAALAGVDEVYAVGGAQAIAALAYGTETVRAVDVIVGPGNRWVSTAKREVAAAGVVGVPSSFAGPSEVVVVADGSSPARYAAIDVVVQAEHGPDGLAWLVTWSEEVAAEVCGEVERIVAASARRAEIEATLSDGGYAVLVDGAEEALEVANAIAPEHLELMVADPEALVPMVRAAGAVFTGPYAPASVGDYLAGPSHVLPTQGSARFAGALRVDDFVRKVHVVSLRAAELQRLAPALERIAVAEGLVEHAASVRARLAP